MNRMQKILATFVVLSVVFFGFVMYRVWGSQPPSAVKLNPLPQGTYDIETWGKAYPLYYQSYKKNLEAAPSPTGYGGSVKEQKGERQPEIYMNFKGYPFSEDYTEERGHLYAMEDIQHSKRISAASKGACITCKTPMIEKFYKEMGWNYASAPLAGFLEKAKDHPINCANCHNPENMALRVINPAFIEAMQRRGIDVTKASREEMRSYVCGQCHVEYYFQPGSYKVTLPWDKGLTPQQMYEYYSEKPNGFQQDFIHPDSKVAVLKGQHPDFEEWQNGTHAQFGVSCADCHMPYMRQSGRKYSSHWMTSPLKTLNDSCSPCHAQVKDTLFQRVKAIQDNVWQLQHTAGLTVAQAHEAIAKASVKPGVNAQELDKARELARKAQWFWDYVAAANSMGFHNQTQELNTLGQSIDFAHQAIDTAKRAAGATL